MCKLKDLWLNLFFFFQEPDLRYLVENIWNSQSVLSAHEDLFDLILVRWNKYEEWSPWNCILLTKEEASAHAKLENVTEVRLLFFVCLCCFKAIVSRWVWGRCLSKLRKPQASVKVTKTTLWAAPTRHRNTENLSGNFLPTPIQREGRLEQKGFDTSTSKDNACKMNWPPMERCKNAGTLKKP